MNETLHQAAQSYIEHLKAEGKKDRTIYTYLKDFEQIEGFFGSDTLEKVLPKMKIEACRAGGDAIILKPGQKYFDGLDDKLNVTATVIRWKN